MKLTITPEDFLYHIRQFEIPDFLLIQNIAIQPEGVLFFDCAIKKIIGIDAKASITLSLPNPKTIRIRITESKVLGISVRELLLKIISDNVGIVPGVNVVTTDKDSYAEYTLPVDFIVIDPQTALQSTDGQMTIEVKGFDIKKMMTFFAESAKKNALYGRPLEGSAQK